MTNFFIIWLVFTRLIFFTPFLIEGESMEGSLQNHQIILVNQKFDKNLLKRGDIIVFSFDNDFYYVKRIIGLPGETLKIKDNRVEIKREGKDYQILNEPYLNNNIYHYGDERFFIVPEGEYFVLGDNRDHSKDSRFFEYPYVKLNQIFGLDVYP